MDTDPQYQEGSREPSGDRPLGWGTEKAELRVWTVGRATAQEGRGDAGGSGGPGEGQRCSGRTWKLEKPRSVVKNQAQITLKGRRFQRCTCRRYYSLKRGFQGPGERVPIPGCHTN